MNGRLVKVMWRDIQTVTGAWKDFEETVKRAREQYNLEFETVGYLIFKDSHFLLVASTTDAESFKSKDKEFVDVSIIPTPLVTRIIPLYEKK